MDGVVELAATGVDWVTDKYWDNGYDYVTKKRQRRHHRAAAHPRSGHAAAAADSAHVPSKTSRHVDHDHDLELQSQNSDRVISAYENERDDPLRPPETVLSRRELRQLQKPRSMSNSAYYDGARPRSAQPPRHRYYDENDSDYDERSGRRHGATGRGYDDAPAYDREIIETERYHGPPRGGLEANRGDASHVSRRGAENSQAGAVTQYRRQDEVADYQPRRSRSRGQRQDYYDRERSRSRSRSSSRSSSRSNDGIKGKLDDTFSTSMRGIGVGLAGAVAGGLAGKQLGGNSKHRDRDMLIGALVGGLGANVAENKWRDWNEEREKKAERRDEQRWSGRDGGRSRSAGR